MNGALDREPVLESEVRESSHLQPTTSRFLDVSSWARTLRSSRSILFLAMFVGYVLLAAWMNQSWLYDRPGMVDQWAYLGQSYFFPKLRQLWPQHPSGDLLPLILPAALAYKVLPPILANYALDLVYAGTVLFILFLHIRRLSGTVTALAVTFFAGGYQYLLLALGSDYTDGRVITYYCISLYVISLARRAAPRRAALLLVFAGGAYAGMVYTAILSATYLPVLVIQYVLAFGVEEGSLLAQCVKRVARFALWFLIGILGTTLLLGGVHYAYVGRAFFFENTIQKLLFFVGGGFSPPPAPYWLPTAAWLVVPGAVAFASLYVLCEFVAKQRRIRNICARCHERHVVALLNIVSLLIMLFIELVVNQWSLQLLYFDQTLPITFLGLGALLGKREPRGITLTDLAAISLALVGSLYCLWALGNHQLTYTQARAALTRVLDAGAYNVLGTLTVLTSLVIYLAHRHLGLRVIAIAYLLLFNLYCFPTEYGVFLYGEREANLEYPQSLNSSRKGLLATLELSKFLDSLDPERKCALWYAGQGPYGQLFLQVNAVAYLNHSSLRINHDFPSLKNFGGPLGSEGRPPTPNDQLLVLSPNQRASSLAETALREAGLTAKELDVFRFQLSDGAVIYVTRILTDSA